MCTSTFIHHHPPFTVIEHATQAAVFSLYSRYSPDPKHNFLIRPPSPSNESLILSCFVFSFRAIRLCSPVSVRKGPRPVGRFHTPSRPSPSATDPGPWTPKRRREPAGVGLRAIFFEPFPLGLCAPVFFSSVFSNPPLRTGEERFPSWTLKRYRIATAYTRKCNDFFFPSPVRLARS